jgi:CheY-like chemotaxis protein
MKDNGDEDIIENILFAENAQDAVKMYIEHYPCLVLMDILMPGTDGIECARMIRDIDPGAQISLISNYASDEKAMDAIKSHLVDSRIDKGVGAGALAGMVAFIVKFLSRMV